MRATQGTRDVYVDDANNCAAPVPAQALAPALLYFDVDGYCTGGIDQRRVVTQMADGYRARELGWLFRTERDRASGSVYFCDATVAPIARRDSNLWFTQRIHGLPMNPSVADFEDNVVLCSSRLLDAIRAIYLALARDSGREVVVVHKGGNEGYWAQLALRDVPGLRTVDLGGLGCPKVDAIGRAAPQLHIGRACEFHPHAKRRAGKVVHCPRLELELMAGWVEQHWEAEPRWGAEDHLAADNSGEIARDRVARAAAGELRGRPGDRDGDLIPAAGGHTQ